MEEAKYTVNLEDVTKGDNIEGNWWQYIRHDFAFAKYIPKKIYETVPVSHNSILVHKQKIGDDQFPTTRYHIIRIKNDTVNVIMKRDKKGWRSIIRQNMVTYLKEHKKLPWGCYYNKTYPKEIGGKKIPISEIVYEPIPNYLTFKIPIVAKSDVGMSYNELQEFDIETENELGRKLDTTETIDPIFQSPTIQKTAYHNNDRLYVFDAEIKEINNHIDYWMEYENVWHLLRVEGGSCAPDRKKTTLRRSIDQINVKCSHKALKTYELKEGEKISFAGKLVDDEHFGLMIQGVRKFYTNPI